jgi:hypothetical protein
VNTRLQPSRASDCARIWAPRSGLVIPFLFHERPAVLRTLREAESTCDSIAARAGRCGQGCTTRRSVRLDPLKQVPSYDDCSARTQKPEGGSTRRRARRQRQRRGRDRQGHHRRLRATRGRIVNIGSIQSFVHVRTPNSPAYTTSKHGLLGLTHPTSPAELMMSPQKTGKG